MITTIQYCIMYVMLGLLGVLMCAILGAAFPRMARALRKLGWGCGLFAIALTFYAGAKHKGSISFDSTYIVDAGSYLTTDTVHVAIAKMTALLPDDTTILVYARHYTLSNSTDWVTLDDSHVFSDYPIDYTLADATNYNVLVYADYSSTPTVHTNGVWQIKGFYVPHDHGAVAFPNTKTILKKDTDE